LRGLLKGFWWPFRSLKSVKYFWSYGPNEVYDSLNYEKEGSTLFLKMRGRRFRNLWMTS